jgi:rod shape-determining protein MreB
VLLIDEPMAAAVGAGLPVDRPKGNMIIDIGGGTTEVAVISLCGIVHCEAIRIGGHAFDHAIVSHIRRRHNLVIGDQTAERAKIAIGSAFPGETEITTNIRGVDFVTGLPRSIDVTAAEIHEALSDSLNQVLEACRRALEKVPPDLVPDIINDGIVLAGGGALIRRLDERLEKELSIPVRVAEEPLLTIAHGGEQAIKDPDLLNKIVISDLGPAPIESMA